MTTVHGWRVARVILPAVGFQPTPWLVCKAGQPAAARIGCTTALHSRNQRLVLIPGRPINNRPQVNNLPYNLFQG
jgi:hypothetical protein